MINEFYKNKEYLNQKYLIEKLSINKIAELHEVDGWTILYWLKKYKIPRRSISESLRKEWLGKKYQNKTWLEQKYLIEKCSISEIAKLCKVSMCPIFRNLKKFGIKTRTISEGEIESFKKNPRQGKSGKLASGWKGGRCIDSKGYISVLIFEHSHGRNKRIAEHRLVMEKYLGRHLNPNEIIHHKNGNRTDNRIENLKLSTRQKHQSSHVKEYYKKIKQIYQENEDLKKINLMLLVALLVKGEN
jgi:hypothetical protein